MTITIEQGITIEDGVLISPLPIVKPTIVRTDTPNGNARVSTSVVKFGTGSYTSNSTSGYINVTPITGFAFGTGDFTIEFWLNTSATGTQGLIGMRPQTTNGLYPVLAVVAGKVVFYIQNAARLSSNTLTLNQWTSIALVRSAGNNLLFQDGVQVGAAYVNASAYLCNRVIIGADDYTLGGSPLNGYLDEIRISNIARYTSNYTPATGPFITDANTLLLLHCDGTSGSTSFPDSSGTL
jgi:hypothetical protein